MASLRYRDDCVTTATPVVPYFIGSSSSRPFLAVGETFARSAKKGSTRSGKHGLRPLLFPQMSTSAATMDRQESQPVLTVSALTALVKEVVEGTFPLVWVSGEI